jgi:hypothetical protein
MTNPAQNADTGGRYRPLPPLHLIQMYSCLECGAVVAEKPTHDDWHLVEAEIVEADE